MALKATIHKAELAISDMDRGYYGSHALTVAQHPSETDERLMLRLVAFACQASETLQFGRGISDEDEPALWSRTLDDRITLWVDLGQPDEKRLRHACQRADRVVVYTYGNRVEETWWQKIAGPLTRFDHLSVFTISADEMTALAAMLERTMKLSITISDGEVWVASDTGSVTLVPQQIR
ncbi:YaeQ family protein [Chitinibacteraceae bacterium HSL-7]